MGEFGEYHSLHPVPPRPDAIRVKWSPLQPGAHRVWVRVRDHTCECSPLVFERCVAGGLGFVRRYDRSVSPQSVVDSPWVRVRDAVTLWRQIMQGEAR